MRKRNILQLIFMVMFSMLSGWACTQSKVVYRSPAGYDLTKPVKYYMSDNLTEISGITFYKGRADSVYAEEDEKGRVYYFKLGDKESRHVTFGKSGDYEDIAILGDKVYMLRSDGTFFVFPFSQLRTDEITNPQKVGDALGKGEYEGLYADESSQMLYALCKHCNADKTSKTCTVYGLKPTDNGIDQAGKYTINVREIEARLGQGKIAFHPSALTKNQKTNEWYILSSVNKVLVVADAGWKVKAVYPLNPELFNQPEGIAFDAQQNLYISNEGDEISSGNILKFNFKNNK